MSLLVDEEKLRKLVNEVLLKQEGDYFDDAARLARLVDQLIDECRKSP